MCCAAAPKWLCIKAVSYTHLDVYKRQAQKRAGELEKLICKIYEDNALGKLPDARYRALDAQYAKEQDTLEIEIMELEKAVTCLLYTSFHGERVKPDITLKRWELNLTWLLN